MLSDFQTFYGAADGVRVFRAPGRVNIIGEHTDYNFGFVLPMALDLATYAATAPANGRKLRIHSEDKQETRDFDVAEIPALRPQRHWTDYPIGVAQEVLRLGFPLDPANILIRSTVPEGSGLSSSAAIEVACALAFLRGRPIDPLELARLCQRAERNFVGIPCGIMDQYVSVFGREHSAVEIDCRSLTHRYVRLPGGAAFVAVNTMVKHALAGSAYRDRVQECAEAVKALKHRFPEVDSLRDVSPEQLESAAGLMPKVVAKRARHVVTEDERLQQFVDTSEQGDLRRMGELMAASHRSLRDDYEVSCAELDFLVDAALKIPGVYGARMTGGGFGGCIVAMMRPEAAEAFGSAISAAYRNRFQIEPAIYDCHPAPGAGELKKDETIRATGD
jgi:galactokinase